MSWEVEMGLTEEIADLKKMLDAAERSEAAAIDRLAVLESKLVSLEKANADLHALCDDRELAVHRLGQERDSYASRLDAVLVLLREYFPEIDLLERGILVEKQEPEKEEEPGWDANGSPVY